MSETAEWCPQCNSLNRRRNYAEPCLHPWHDAPAPQPQPEARCHKCGQVVDGPPEVCCICPKDRVESPAPSAALTMRPCELREAKQFVTDTHRHHRAPQGHRFSLKATVDGKTVGVAIVGRPVARHQQDGETLEITRLCTDGTPNAVSFLVGAVKRAGRALGYKRLISYTLIEENGASWRASGMTQTGTTSGGAWSGTYGDGKKRANDHPLQEKRRWEIRL